MINWQRYLSKNGSTLLSIAGALGVVATAVSAVKSTPKVIKDLEEMEYLTGDELSTRMKIKIATPHYIPTALIGVSTISCIFGANVINKNHQAAITSAYALLDQTHKEYKNKVNELYGDTVERELAKDHYNKRQPIVRSGEDSILFYDEYSRRYFESTMENVLQAEYNINKDLNTNMVAYLNDWYSYLGIGKPKYGKVIGWSQYKMYGRTFNNWLDFQHDAVEMDDGLECVIVTFGCDPVHIYDD